MERVLSRRSATTNLTSFLAISICSKRSLTRRMHVSDMLESMAIEDGFLHTGHEAETQSFADFADLTEEVEVQDDCLAIPLETT